jgi:hypothetical protein
MRELNDPRALRDADQMKRKNKAEFERLNAEIAFEQHGGDRPPLSQSPTLRRIRRKPPAREWRPL